MKNKLLAIIVLFGLTMTSLFASPILKSNAALSKEQTTSARTVSDTDIEGYISGKTSPGQLFYPYDIIVNKVVSWTEEHYYTGYSEDEQGDAYFNPDQTNYNVPTSYTFQKGYVYLINAALVERNVASSDIENNIVTWDYESISEFYKLYDYNFNNSNDSNFDFNEQIGCDADYYYANDMHYVWDNEEICNIISSKWTSRITSLFNGAFSSNFAAGGRMAVVVPKNDLTITRNSTALTYGLEVFIHKGKMLTGDFIAPEIGGTVNLSVNVDNQPSVDEILSHVRAIDETDGIVPIKVTSSTYTPGEMKVGEYYINLSATDSAGNTGTGKITISRFDSTLPTIEGQTNYDLNYNHDVTLQKVLDNLTTSDNVDTNLSLEVVSDTFTGNEHKLGNYQIVVRTKDKSNNYSANKTVNLGVKNKGYAVFTAPKEITVTISEPLTLEDLKAQVFCHDGYDGEITNYTITGFDEYTSTSRNVGYNDITFSYVNSGNNETTATVSLKKVDDMVPGIYFDLGYFVILAAGENFTMTQFKQHAAKVLHVNLSDIVSVEGEYDTSEIGTYTLMVCLADETTEEFTILVGTEAATVQTSSFWDIFTRFFWINSWNVATANLFHASAWNWLNWTFIAIIIIVIIVVIGVYRYYRKKHPKIKKR